MNFKLGNDTLKITDSYSYLGITFSRNGSYQEAINLLKEKSNKAMFLLRSSLYTGVTFQPNLPLKIFDSTVRPILTYSSEVWCIQYIKLLFKPNLIDKSSLESVNNRFCKCIFGLPRQASNFAVKAELGKNPIFAYVCAQAVRFWYHIIGLKSDRLLKCAYLSEVEVHRNGGNSRATFIIKLLELIDAKEFWVKQGNLSLSQEELSKLKKKTTVEHVNFAT